VCCVNVHLFTCPPKYHHRLYTFADVLPLTLTFNELMFEFQLLWVIAYRKVQRATQLWQAQSVPSALACKRPAVSTAPESDMTFTQWHWHCRPVTDLGAGRSKMRVNCNLKCVQNWRQRWTLDNYNCRTYSCFSPNQLNQGLRPWTPHGVCPMAP